MWTAESLHRVHADWMLCLVHSCDQLEKKMVDVIMIIKIVKNIDWNFHNTGEWWCIKHFKSEA